MTGHFRLFSIVPPYVILSKVFIFYFKGYSILRYSRLLYLKLFFAYFRLFLIILIYYDITYFKLFVLGYYDYILDYSRLYLGLKP
jgi:hypothetical protein